MKLSDQILNKLKSYTSKIVDSVLIEYQDGAHVKKNELIQFLSDVASVSDKISLVLKSDSKGSDPLKFEIKKNDLSHGIYFDGIPSGHEFNSFILAILQVGGAPLSIDNDVQKIITGLNEELNFEIIVSLSCENCPDVVQALNQFAILNPKITNTTIDGGLHPDMINARKVQSVPTIFLNGEEFASGRVSIAKILDKLMKVDKVKVSTKSSNIPLQDVTIIGGGPAGISSAIYAARKGLDVTIIAEKFGGQLTETIGIENFISTPYTTGKELTDDLKKHSRQYNIKTKEHVSVTNINSGEIKTVTLSTGEIFQTKTIIIATGAKWRTLNVPGEKELIGKGVAYCPHCDGPFYQGKDVVVVGGGNSGIEAAIDLSNIAKNVKVIEFLPFLKADKILRDKARSLENISFILNSEVQTINDENGKVAGITYIDKSSNEIYHLKTSAVFVQIGLIPNSSFVKNVVELNNYNEIIINDKCETSQSGIFACGDVSSIPHKQIIVSMGNGASAALSASDYLIKNENSVASVKERTIAKKSRKR